MALREHPVVPYEDDAVTRIIQDAVHTPVYEASGTGRSGNSGNFCWTGVPFRRH
ncbi:MAG: hypothetical protein ACLSHC_17110 [Bilophila wadsworthia]